ncbi:16S rRNA (adenine(1518)-N(6)/adenine(1519)-N(6))-dimethyltransferase RsmA [Treponema sp. TIM-1]|uniref:16S rRNA (adenine(1518)-N(6)/adenine(1519)-N(6))- dimethyltransferase RsmA n=1 Tax=Treponema sp. TIM-1 TaxID=2898417 RepID=UPI00397FA766
MSPLINYDSARNLSAFLDEQGLGMRKKFGQNFLINPGAREKLLDALEIKQGDAVWEIGPGLGAMTGGLLERGAAVTAFEIDRGFSLILKDLFKDHTNFTLVEGDVLKTWKTVKDPAPFLLGNLPYNIGAVLLADFIEGRCFFKRMVVTLQRETANRMLASPLSKDYSSFSVLCASVYTITPLMILKGASFYPIPKVESQGVRLDLRTDRVPGRRPVFFNALVRSLFSSRRKTLRNNLQNFVLSGIINKDALGTKERVQEFCMTVFAASGIDPNKRAEALGYEDFITLARTLEDISGRI